MLPPGIQNFLAALQRLNKSKGCGSWSQASLFDLQPCGQEQSDLQTLGEQFIERSTTATKRLWRLQGADEMPVLYTVPTGTPSCSYCVRCWKIPWLFGRVYTKGRWPQDHRGGFFFSGSALMLGAACPWALLRWDVLVRLGWGHSWLGGGHLSCTWGPRREKSIALSKLSAAFLCVLPSLLLSPHRHISDVY